MIRLDAATVLLQWAAGGWTFLWFSTRRGEIGAGYGWLLRSIYVVMAAGALATGIAFGVVAVREGSAAVAAVVGLVVLMLSIVRRPASTTASGHPQSTPVNPGFPDPSARRAPLPAWADLVVPAIAVVGLVAAAIDAAGDDAGVGRIAVSLLRTLAGAAFLGAVTDAMLLGHWYLVQPGLPRKHLNELVRVLGVIWPIEVAALLLPTGMVSVWLGTVDDGWNGTLGWFWGASAATTIVLVFVTRAALKERSYSAVMAATGLLYLAILTAFGTDLVARAVLAG